MIEIASDLNELRPRIAVIGVGGAGGNAVANMIRSEVQGVECIVANTDAQALRDSHADRIIQLGRGATGGLGAGSRAEVGKAAAEESLAEIEKILDGAHMCFIAAGLGGGTGTGAAPVIARAARDKGILTVGVVTKPFAFEGTRRARAAEQGLEELQQAVDTLIVIPNQNLFRIANAGTTFKAAFDLADEVLQQGVRGITDLMVMPGLINLDFADIRTIMANMGKAMMGTGEASGEDRALNAAERAIANPLLDEALKGARGLIISISGGEDMRLMEVDEVASHIKEMVDPEADIIWGSAFNAELEGRIRVSVVATGIDTVKDRAELPAPVAALRTAPLAAPVLAPVAAPAPVMQMPVIERPEPVAAEAPQPSLLDMLVAPAACLDADEPGELLLTAERALTLAAPEGAIEIATLDPFAAVEPEAAAPCTIAPLRGPSLFERMAMAARGAARQAREPDGPPLPQLYRGRDLHSQPRIARAA